MSDEQPALHAFSLRQPDGDYACRHCLLLMRSYLASDPHPACPGTPPAGAEEGEAD